MTKHLDALRAASQLLQWHIHWLEGDGIETRNSNKHTKKVALHLSMHEQSIAANAVNAALAVAPAHRVWVVEPSRHNPNTFHRRLI